MSFKRLLAPVLALLVLAAAIWAASRLAQLPPGPTRRMAMWDEIVTTLAPKTLAGKKIACLGDSITYGSGGLDKADGTKVSYCDYLAQYSGAQVVNLGIGGSPLGGVVPPGGDESTIMVNRYRDIPQDSDIILLMAGLNDFFIGPECFGSMEEQAPHTYCGDAVTLFNGLAEAYPDAEIWIVIPFDCWQNHEDALEARNFPYENYVKVQRELAQQHGFHLLDLYAQQFLDNNDPEIANAFFSDSVHPADAGYRLLARHIYAALLLG